MKIGFTSNLDARRRQLEAHYGRPLALLATMKGDEQAERELHERFAHVRLGRTEQFRPGPELMGFIGRLLLVGANPDAVEVVRPLLRFVRLDDDLVEKAKKVAALKGISLAEYVSDAMWPIVNRDLAKEVKKLSGNDS